MECRDGGILRWKKSRNEVVGGDDKIYKSKGKSYSPCKLGKKDFFFQESIVFFNVEKKKKMLDSSRKKESKELSRKI